MAYPVAANMIGVFAGEVPVPGKTMGPVAVVERDYAAIADKWSTLGPLVDNLGVTTKGITTHPARKSTSWGQVRRDGFWPGQGRPAITLGRGGWPT